jgi:hypothetical protein
MVNKWSIKAMTSGLTPGLYGTIVLMKFQRWRRKSSIHPIGWNWFYELSPALAGGTNELFYYGFQPN